MHSATHRALQDFDNQHEFEPLAADVLNALGFSDVEPIAPRGGADGGKDIKFREGELAGVAFVTLDKGIRDKFAFDFAKLNKGEGKIALFCNVDVTPKNRVRSCGLISIRSVTQANASYQMPAFRRHIDLDSGHPLLSSDLSE